MKKLNILSPKGYIAEEQRKKYYKLGRKWIKNRVTDFFCKKTLKVINISKQSQLKVQWKIPPSEKTTIFCFEKLKKLQIQKNIQLKVIS